MEGSQESGELASNILELSRPGCSRQPLLSGVFHDVRMYVSSVPEMSEMNINTQRGSSTKSVKLTKSPNMTSKSSNKLSNRKKSCMQSNVSVLDENFDFSTPVLSSTRLNASNLMMTEPRPSTSFRHDDDLASTPIDMGQAEPELRVKRVTFNHVDMVTHRGKRIKTNNNSVQNIETILQSPDSCSKTPDESDQLNTTTQFNDLSTNKTALQNLESLPGTPTSSKIDMPSSSETSHVRVLESKNVVKSTTEDKAVSVPKTRSRPKAKKTFSNTPALPIKRITRSKYRRPIKHVDSIYTGSKSDQSRKSDSKRSESLGNNQNSDVSKSPASVSKNQTSVSKNQRSVSKNQRSVSKNQTNASKNQSNITNDESSVSNNTIKSENVSKISSQSVNDTNASTKNRRIGKRKVQELSSETLTASPRKRRGTKEVSLKEPSLRKKMRR